MNSSTRTDHPSGWLHLTRHESIPVIVDALLDLPPGYEFSETGLAEHAGVERQIVEDHTGLLLEVDIIEEIQGTSPQRYQVSDSNVVRELFELNSALNSVGSG